MRTLALAVSLLLLAALRSPADDAAPLPTDDPKSVALNQASDQGDLAKVQSLVAAGAPVDGHTGKYAFSPLTAAADEGHLDVLKFLIASHASVDLADAQGSTPLLHACSTDHAPCALALLEAGANPNLGSKWNRFPLMYASQHGDNPIVSALLAHHADVNATCDNGPAIWWAAGDRHYDTLKLLLDAGADPNMAEKSRGDPSYPALPLLGYPASAGDTKNMDLLLSHGYAINTPAVDGNTALTIAVIYRKPGAVKWLLAHQAALDLQNEKGETALILAARARDPEILPALLAAGAKLNLQDKTGRTALIWAAREWDETTARQLIDHGADVNVTDAQGETALTYAGNVGSTDLVDLLKSKGAIRTDVHIIAGGQPAVAPSAAQAWALGVGAIYAQADGLNHQFLDGQSLSTQSAAGMLHDSWGVRNRAGFFHEFKWLVDSGHRARFQVEGARLANMSTLERVLLEFYLAEISFFSPKADKALRHMQNSLASYQKWGDRDGLAWDLCRAANLIRYGYAAHYLGEQEAWDNLLPIARQVQGKFSSWQEMNDNFLDGREIWADKRDPRFDACAQLLLNPKDPNSPWNQNPWKTDLSGK